jgi:hypothetical protein
MKLVIIAVAAIISGQTTEADPQIDSWYTRDSRNYAQIYPTIADQSAGKAVTTWSRGPGVQSVPVFAGVHDVSSSPDWVYIHTSGLASYVMGPWYLGSAKTRLFPSFPADTKTTYRIPRHPTISATKTLTGLGPIGYFVNGVALFDNRDAFYWNGKFDAQGEGLWNRDAFVNEAVTFDAGMAHQARAQYHYHANPIALRYQLGDHVDFTPSNNYYGERSGTATKHSPILGWVRDGLPVYGPYGYSDPMNSKSGVRRMTSGYVIRDGNHGTQNLTLTGRTTIPKWAARAYGRSATLTRNEYGPTISASSPLGRYIEDNDYLGDHGKDFDLNEYNARFCVTPAYFVTIDGNGAPMFPYDIGACFVGDPKGSMVRSINEPVKRNFIAQAENNSEPVVAANDSVTLVWNANDAGYQVESR